MNLIERAKQIIIAPKSEWLVIDQETTPVAQAIISYLIPLSIIPAVFSFIGYGVIGYTVSYIGHVPGSMFLGISRAVIAFLSPVLIALLSSFIISTLAPSFDALKDFRKSFQLVTYSYTPTLVAGIFYILPSLWIIALLAGIYGFYILYLGFAPILKAPEDKATGYFVVSLISIIVSAIVIGIILTALFSLFAVTGGPMMMR